MRGTLGLIVGLVIVALGLGGLGVAFSQMMTHSSPESALISVGGLAVFAVSCLFILVTAYRS